MQFADKNIGEPASNNRLSKAERNFLRQQAILFLKELQDRSLVAFDAEITFSNRSFYINLTGAKARKLTLRLSDHKPVGKVDSKSVKDPKSIWQKESQQTAREKPTACVNNPEGSELGRNQNESTEIEMTSSSNRVLTKQEKPLAIPNPVRAHPLSQNPKRRKGRRILWSWSYDSFASWSDFEKLAKQVIRNWMASECLGGKMRTWNKDRF
ncbi:MAG: hypothetical protein FWC59_01385 [Actinomycetia bacterium]|nr:hypothetical protein [Actinomycetes bacterium]